MLDGFKRSSGKKRTKNLVQPQTGPKLGIERDVDTHQRLRGLLQGATKLMRIADDRRRMSNASPRPRA